MSVGDRDDLLYRFRQRARVYARVCKSPEYCSLSQNSRLLDIKSYTETRLFA